MAGPQVCVPNHYTLLPSAAPPGAARVKGRRLRGCGGEGVRRGGLTRGWAQAPVTAGGGSWPPTHRAPGDPGCAPLRGPPPASRGRRRARGREAWRAAPSPLPPGVGTEAAALPVVRGEALGHAPGGTWDPEPLQEARPAAPPSRSVPARKRWRRGGGAEKRFRGRGVRAGAAAGAAGTGLAPAAAEGAPRAGDVSAALSAGETRWPGAAGGGRGAGGAGEAGDSPRPLSGSLWARRGGSLRAWSVRRAGGRRGLEPRPGGVGRPRAPARARRAPPRGHPCSARSPGAAGGAEGRARPTAPSSPASVSGVWGSPASGPFVPGRAPPLYGRSDG